MIYIRDPLLPGNCSTTSGGPACFPGNIIPASRIDKNGQALLNMLPMPNTSDPTGRNEYNYAFQTVQDWPRNDQVLRVDWNVAQSTQAYSRLQFGKETRSGGVSILGSTGGWPQMATRYDIDTVGWVSTVLHTFSPTLFGEFTVGVNWAHQNTAPFDQAEMDKNDRTKVLPGLPQYFPESNPMNLVPNANFGGGVPGTILSLGIENRFPFFGYNTLLQLLDEHHQGEPVGTRSSPGSSWSIRPGPPSGPRTSTGTSASTPTARTLSTPTSVSRTRCSAR